jgi:hypothetical protein
MLGINLSQPIWRMRGVRSHSVLAHTTRGDSNSGKNVSLRLLLRSGLAPGEPFKTSKYELLMPVKRCWTSQGRYVTSAKGDVLCASLPCCCIVFRSFTQYAQSLDRLHARPSVDGIMSCTRGPLGAGNLTCSGFA